MRKRFTPGSLRAALNVTLSATLNATLNATRYAALSAALGATLPAIATPQAAVAASPGASATVATTATAGAAQHDRLQAVLDRYARSVQPGVLGVAVLDMRSSAEWRVNGERPFPMMSVFKAPLAAAALDLVDRGRLPPTRRVTITRDQLRAGESAIRTNFQGEQMSFTIAELLRAAVSESDNTAADALMRAIGGPGVVTAYLHAHGIDGMHVEMDEGQVADLFRHTGSAAAPPAGETAAQRRQRQQDGLSAYLNDPRNRSTPLAAVDFLRKLANGALLSPASTQQLLTLMQDQTRPRRLRAGLPAGVTFADKCGTSLTVDGVTAAFNDIGIISWPDGRRVIVAAFLSASSGSRADRDALFAGLATAIAQRVRD